MPDVSPTTVESVLGSMVKNGLVDKVGSGMSTKCIKNYDIVTCVVRSKIFANESLFITGDSAS